jgi:hypothetical protein
MTAGRSIADRLELQSVALVESTIPAELTIGEWRRRRRPRPEACDHLHDSTSRYDHEAKQLTFLLVCPVCETERVVDSIPYEPRFTPQAPSEPAGATVHQLPVRRVSQPERQAA